MQKHVYINPEALKDENKRAFICALTGVSDEEIEDHLEKHGCMFTYTVNVIKEES